MFMLNYAKVKICLLKINATYFLFEQNFIFSLTFSCIINYNSNKGGG